MSWDQLDLELAEIFDEYTWRREESDAAIEFWSAQRAASRREYWRERMRRCRAQMRVKLGLPPAKKYAYGLSKKEKLARRREKQNARWARRRVAAGFPEPRKYRRGVTVEQRREENRLRVAALRARRRAEVQAA